MTGQMSLFDLLPKDVPDLMAPGLYSRSSLQRFTAERKGDIMELAIWTENEAMIIRVNADEFMEYINNV